MVERIKSLPYYFTKGVNLMIEKIKEFVSVNNIHIIDEIVEIMDLENVKLTVTRNPEKVKMNVNNFKSKKDYYDKQLYVLHGEFNQHKLQVKSDMVFIVLYSKHQKFNKINEYKEVILYEKQGAIAC